MNKNNNITDFLQSGTDAAVKLKALQGGFDALGNSVDKAAGTLASASQAMTGSMAVLEAGMTRISLSAALVVNSIASMASALTASAEAQAMAQAGSTGTASAFELLQAQADQVKANFLGLMGSASGAFMAFTDGAAVTDTLLSLFQRLGPVYDSLKGKVLALSLAQIKATALQKTQNAVQQVGIGITKMLTVVQKAWNLAMNSGPVGLLLIAVTGLVGYLVSAYNTFDDFRGIVDKTWESVKQLGAVVWDFLVGAFEKVSSVVSTLFGKLKSFLGIEEEVAGASGRAAAGTDKLGDANKKTAGTTDLLSRALADQNKNLSLNLSTIGGVEQKISQLKQAQKNASAEQAIALEKEIRLWEKKRRGMENAIKIGAAEKPEIKLLDAPPLAKPVNPVVAGGAEKLQADFKTDFAGVSGGVETVDAKVQSFSESIFSAGGVISQWANSATADIRRMIDICTELGNTMAGEMLNSIQLVGGSLMGVGAIMGAMGGIVDGAAGGWLKWGANILAMVSTALPQLLALFGVESALAVAEQAKIPFPLNIIAIGATIAGIAAAIMSVPKPKQFAAGGLVYGNTFAQVGEYPGAANNPEVIAPLSKLRNLLTPQGSGGGVVEFRIKGNRLVGVLDKEGNKGRFF